MELGLLAIAAIPTTIGVWQSVEEGKKAKKEAADERRMQKFNLEVYCDAESEGAKVVDGMKVVLWGEKLYLDHPSAENRTHPKAHPFSGFYIAYPPDPDVPSKSIRGLVSTISNDPPMLNWIYAHRETGELRYGNRTQSKEHVVGSWDWTEDLEGLVLEGREGFVVVEEEVDGEEEEKGEDGKGGKNGKGEEREGKGKGNEEDDRKGKVWAVYYDQKGDRLRNLEKESGRRRRRVLEVSLERKIVG